MAGRHERNLDAESLEVNDGGKHDECCDQVHNVGQILAVESLAESDLLVGPSKEKVEQSNDRSLEFRPSAGVVGGRRECLPDDGFTNVCRNEEGNSASESVSLLQKFVEEDDNQSSNDQLYHKQDANAGTKV